MSAAREAPGQTHRCASAALVESHQRGYIILSMSHHPALDADRWMDSDNPHARPSRSLLGVAVAAWNLPRKVYRFVFTSPGVITLVALTLILAILAAGGAMVYSSTSRQNELNTLIGQTEPLANSSQELYNALSVADSVATTGFLQQGRDNIASEDEYNRAIGDASHAILRASNGIEQINSREMEIVVTLQQELPNYITLVAQARTNDRMRNPVGASYLTEASALMQSKLLPRAQELHMLTSQNVTAQQHALIRPLWFPLSGLLAAVIMLVVVQLWLAAKTHRRINVGYVIATGLMVIALLWTSGTSALMWVTGNRTFEGSSQPLAQLTQARISAQQARTNEALGLVQRDYGQLRQEEFSNHVSTISSTLEQLRDTVAVPSRVDHAREALRLWDEAHASMVYDMQGGNFTKAIQTTLSSEAGEKAAAPNYAILDDELQNLISEQRAKLRDLLENGRESAVRVTNLVTVLTILAALCVIFGTRPRLQEYL